MPVHEVPGCTRDWSFGASEEGANVRQLCRRFGIRPTIGYKWLEHWRTGGVKGLQEQSVAGSEMVEALTHKPARSCC
jgi:transposase-like protein